MRHWHLLPAAHRRSCLCQRTSGTRGKLERRASCFEPRVVYAHFIPDTTAVSRFSYCYMARVLLSLYTPGLSRPQTSQHGRAKGHNRAPKPAVVTNRNAAPKRAAGAVKYTPECQSYLLLAGGLLQVLLSNFWTSRGHRCRPFFPPVVAFNFYRAYLEGLSNPTARRFFIECC